MNLNQIFRKKLPIEIISIIQKYFDKKKIINKHYCYFCKIEVSYDEYVDGAGYICYSCMYN